MFGTTDLLAPKVTSQRYRNAPHPHAAQLSLSNPGNPLIPRILIQTFPVPHPTIPVPHPSIPVPHPSIPVPHPSIPVPHPTIPVPHPAIPAPHPTIPVPHPAIPAPHPATPAPHPATPIPHHPPLPSATSAVNSPRPGSQDNEVMRPFDRHERLCYYRPMKTLTQDPVHGPLAAT